MQLLCSRAAAVVRQPVVQSTVPRRASLVQWRWVMPKRKRGPYEIVFTGGITAPALLSKDATAVGRRRADRRAECVRAGRKKVRYRSVPQGRHICNKHGLSYAY